MNTVLPYTMVRILAFFLAGILTAVFFPEFLSPRAGFIILIVLFVGYLLSAVLHGKRMGLNGTGGVVGLLAIALVGFLRICGFKDTASKDHFIHYTGNVTSYVAELTKPPKERKKTWQCEARIRRVNDGKMGYSVHGNMMLYIVKDHQNIRFSYGDKLLIKGLPTVLKPPSNPYEFDFKTFLNHKNIYHRHRVQRKQVYRIPSEGSKDFFYYVYAVQSWAAHQLKTYIQSEQAQVVALALTLGITDGMDNDLREAYAASGAMHILAVSGLHVGIIYGIILLLLHPLKRYHRGLSVTAVVSVTALWCYACLTGLSPSVLRAVTMFSCIALARLLNRSTNIYNTLAGSAFLLLCFNPYLITSVGFQLSYLAVLGIVFLYKPVYALWEPRSVWLDRVWSITCISMAAQLATFPLGLLYFHQFPVYFLLSNLFVVPGAMIILIVGILTILTGFLPSVASFLGWILQHIIEILNEGIFFIQHIPYSIIERVYITPLQSILILIMLLFSIFLLRWKKYSYFMAVLICALVFTTTQWVHFYREVAQKRLVVYNIPGRTGVEWIEKGTAYFYADEHLIHDRNRIRFHILPNRLFCGVSEQRTYYNSMKQNEAVKILHREGKKIAIINKNISLWPEEWCVDYLIIGHNAFPSLEAIRKTIRFDKLILNSSNSVRYCDRIMREKGNAWVYSVVHQGAYVEKF